MDINFNYILSGIISLVLLLKFLQLNNSTDYFDSKEHKISSYTIVGILVFSVSYINSDPNLLYHILIICIPYFCLSYFKLFKDDKKKFTKSIVAIVIIVALAFYINTYYR
jgi:hypothetical protein